ncbi:MAG: Maf family protein [Polyangiaceae bacterium]
MGLSNDRPLLLASGSPRRRALLRSAGIPLRVQTFEVDEALKAGEGPELYLERVVRAKREAGKLGLASSDGALLVADTVVVLDGEVLGKPAHAGAARSMVRALAGREHAVMTRFSVSAAHAGRCGASVEHTVVTTVAVRPLSDALVDAYVATGEGLDKAGAYAIQGKFAFAVSRITGSYTNVVGLPLAEVVQALEALELFDAAVLAGAELEDERTRAP